LQLDASLFGPDNAWGFHLTNLALHLTNVLLVYCLLFRMTSAPWRSAIVAALFAIHPLHVESVAWVTERKDVLSTLFFLLALPAYIRYVEGAVSRKGSAALITGHWPLTTCHYWLVLLWFF